MMFIARYDDIFCVAFAAVLEFIIEVAEVDCKLSANLGAPYFLAHSHLR